MRDHFTVAVELLNDKGRVIGRRNVTLPYGWKTGFSRENGELAISPVSNTDIAVTFNAVKADDVTDKLNINIAGINGETAQAASKNKRISILPLNEYAKKVYAIGDSGPAGGTVFYSTGVWYMEAAPKGSEKELEWRDAVAYCRTLNTGGYNDWRLPDEKELDLMYKNLKTKKLGGFSNDDYWSSSEFNNGSAVRYQDFGDGDRYVDYKDETYSVRAVRGLFNPAAFFGSPPRGGPEIFFYTELN
jgi:hypothetical protein